MKNKADPDYPPGRHRDTAHGLPARGEQPRQAKSLVSPVPCANVNAVLQEGQNT